MRFFILIAISAFICFSLGTAYPQKTFFDLPVSASRNCIVAEDRFGSLYIVSGSQLYAFSSDGSLMFIFGKNAYGAITSIDAADPMKILVCFGQKAYLYMIDNKGNPIGSYLDLSASGISTPGDICMSGIGSIWVYDQEEQCAKQFSQSGTIISQTSNIGRYVPIEYAESVKIGWANKCLIITAEHTISTFSAEGAYMTSYAIGTTCQINTIANGGALFSCGDTVFLYNSGSLQVEKVGLFEHADALFFFKEYYISKVSAVAQVAAEKTADKNRFVRSAYLSE